VSPTLANFLFESANFLLLAAALGWLLFKPVRAAIDAERDRHAEEERRVAALRDEAEALGKQIREAQQRLAGDIERERAAALAEVPKEVERLKEEARKAREAELRAFERESEATRHLQTGLLADALGRVAAASVRRLLETLDGPSLDLALVRGACEELGKLPEAARRAATVEAARPLGDEARRLLHATLGGEVEEHTVQELGAGVRVTTPSGQVDASALALARQAEREVAGAAASAADENAGSDG
jgi:F0F1-type ATP synthase membrane subunit b/b'